MQVIRRAASRTPVAVAALLLTALNLQAQPQQGQGNEPKAEELTCGQLRREAMTRALTEKEKGKLVVCRMLGDIPRREGDHSTTIKPPTW